jgi:hypothetical protein
MRRISALEIRHYGEMMHYLEPGRLLGPDLPSEYERAWNSATAASFQHQIDHAAQA